MSRYHPTRNIEPVLEAANYWKSKSLLGGESVFESTEVWGDSSLEALREYYARNLDYGEGDFLGKLKGQLEAAPANAKKLAAEMLWVMSLCPSNVGDESKRENVMQVWEWSGEQLPASDRWLSSEVLVGIGSGGPAFNTQRWRELVFFVDFVGAFRKLPSDEAHRLLDDPWGFAEWIDNVEGADRRQLRHMILYLLFPDTFERIFGSSERKKFLAGMADLSKSQINRMSASEISKEIFDIRAAQERILDRSDFDFYEPPLAELWKKVAVSENSGEVAEPRSSYLVATEGLSRQHVLASLAEIDRDGYPDDAKSSTYDLIHGDRRYPPKYVLSIAAKHANGEELSRQEFSGGKDSQSFKTLTSLGFHIEIKTFTNKLLRDFIAQANESSDLATKSYSKEYRGLKVKVSFGQGNFAKVPWISFTGYGQTTSEGIYPVILYYKSIGILVVAYGLSETAKPSVVWDGLEELQTIAEYFAAEQKPKPDRYGASYVAKAFDLTAEEDLAGIEVCLDQLIGSYHQQFESKAPETKEVPQLTSYGIAEALDGLFIEEEKFEEILALLKRKQNLILQGPPGVGKTFVCKRLGYALMGEKAAHRLGMVQFHQSYAYEDFVQGYRPSGTGFRLKNGLFHEFCERAKQDPTETYVFVIDEINRGNLSKIFGELMLLIESDKRGQEWGIPLTYSEDTEERFYIPENLYLIGLMNTADRSLAMVDYALRRRFAFAELEPGFNTDEFRDYMADMGAESDFVEDLISRFDTLNTKIAQDVTNLGPGYCVGHSFFCSVSDGETPNWQWYEQIIRTEISPLLREYYFDDEKQANTLIQALLRAL